MPIKSRFNFQYLEVYNMSLELTKKVFKITKNWPREFLFDLTSQFRRAILSIPLNIAEGSSRSKKDFQRFIDISRGSCFECIALIEIAFSQNLLTLQVKLELEEKITIISKMLSKLKTSLNMNQ